MKLIHSFSSHPSIKRRCFALDDVDVLPGEDPDARIARFTHWSLELSAQTIEDAPAMAAFGAGLSLLPPASSFFVSSVSECNYETSALDSLFE